MTYNWQHQNWPNFNYKIEGILPVIIAFAEESGEVNGLTQGLSKELNEEMVVSLMLSEAMKTSEIEGEFINRDDVMSSIRNNLGLNEKQVPVKDQRAERVSQLMIMVRKSFDEPLKIEMLLEWHRILMINVKHINAGEWRTGSAAMQVISGAYGKETVHFEAPPSLVVPNEMERFIEWYNKSMGSSVADVGQAILRSAIAHLYFESIHPFEDGNGRIGRAIAEKALSQSLGRPVMLSLSKIIEKDKSAYYDALKAAQGTLDISDWIGYFANIVLEAQRDAKDMIQFTLFKTKFFDKYLSKLNERQLKAINKMLSKGNEGFKGGMTAKKYMSINKTSKATATRDLQDLLEHQVIILQGAGRSVSYELNLSL